MTVLTRLDPDRPCRVAGCRFEALPAPGSPVRLCRPHRILASRGYVFSVFAATVEAVVIGGSLGGERHAA